MIASGDGEPEPVSHHPEALADVSTGLLEDEPTVADPGPFMPHKPQPQIAGAEFQPRRQKSRGPVLKTVRAILLTAKIGVFVLCVCAGVGVLFYITSLPDLLISLSAALSWVTAGFLAIYFVATRGAMLSPNVIAYVGLADVLAALLSLSALFAAPKETDTIAEALLGMLVQVAILGLILLGWRLAKVLAPTGLGILQLDFLVLRSFQFDEPRLEEAASRALAVLMRLTSLLRWLPFCEGVGFPDDLKYAWSYEASLRSGLGRKAKAATVFNPHWSRGIPPIAGNFIKVPSGQDWKAVVRSAFDRTRWVIAMAGGSPGLRDELAMIRQDMLTVQRLLVLPPQDIEPDLVCSYTDALKEAGFGVAADGTRPGSLYRFTADAVAYEVCGSIESAKEAALEVLASTKLTTTPNPEWCPFDGRDVQPSSLGRCPRCGLILSPDLAEEIGGIHTMCLSGIEREKKTAALYDFITSEQYHQLVRRMDERTNYLFQEQEQEVKWHEAHWKREGEAVRGIQKAQTEIDNMVAGILGSSSGESALREAS